MAKPDPTTLRDDPLPDLPDGDTEPANGVRIGESPLPGLRLRRILFRQQGLSKRYRVLVKRVAWAPKQARLAASFTDRAIRIWDLETNQPERALFGHTETIYGIAWSPDGSRLASASRDCTVRIWDAQTGELQSTLEGHTASAISVAWSPDGKMLASTGDDSAVRLWDAESGKTIRILEHPGLVQGAVWSPDGEKLVSISTEVPQVNLWHFGKGARLDPDRISLRKECALYSLASMPGEPTIAFGSCDGGIFVLDWEHEKWTHTLEGHTDMVTSLSFSPDGRILASKSKDHTVRFWVTHLWEPLASLKELHSSSITSGLAFHTSLPLLATLGEDEMLIRVWHLDSREVNLLASLPLHDAAVRYTTAKLVLVGDSGVGKTGLGWRLAYNHYKEQSSTHGQQFWLIDTLRTKRLDGVECEAVLWDLAGQHVYRAIHSIFLDQVDTALVLFDASDRQDPLRGVQFWLEQLKGKGQLPPSVLVAGRADVCPPALSRQEYEQFCQRHGISGGFIATSAAQGEGIPELLDILKGQIPWEAKITTVTTVTFKRIKDHVLALKEKSSAGDVLVKPKELRKQLEATDAGWQFTDAEMMTAVGNLQTHGYITILKSSAGEDFILLKPDLLAGLAASIVLQADKHPRELGAVSEAKLLQGEYHFPELAGMPNADQQVLLDAAVLRFLEHSVCFREMYGEETLLIFPGLIKQKRPLEDDSAASDDMSYIVRGQVENLYAMLVVLLGYTPSFTRINQWQNQAQYEMGKGEICGFRLYEPHEGEIELVLYYSQSMPERGREAFQELFERFLSQREVDVTPYPPVSCSHGHRLERATLVRRLGEGKDFAFCDECGDKVMLPQLRRGIGTGASMWLQSEEAAARLRSSYEAHLARVKGYRRGWSAPRAYLSTAPGEQDRGKGLLSDLQAAGVYLLTEPGQVQAQDFVIVLDTPAYRHAWQHPAPDFASEVGLVKARLGGEKPRLISLVMDGEAGKTTLHDQQGCTPGDFCDPSHYPVGLLDLVLNLYAIPFTFASFAGLRQALHRQWEQMPRQAPVNVQDAAATQPEPPEQYIDFELYIASNGHAVASSPRQGQAMAEISLEAPDTIRDGLRLIEARRGDAELVRQVGRALYEWLFPRLIHAHFHQTEAAAREHGQHVRLRLRIEAAEIANLPLEFIYRQEAGGYFMAINPDTALVRSLNVIKTGGQVHHGEGKLHMLAIIANPSDQPQLKPDDWETLLKEKLAEPLLNGKMSLRVVKQATHTEIRNALLEQNPDIVQFIGHGIYQGGKGYLALVDEQSGATWRVDEEIFANLFLGHADRLGLISLATCESAKSDDPQGFMGIAPKLVQRGIPAVLAMQYAVLVQTAKIFFEDFYTCLAAGKAVDWAVQSARNAVSQRMGLDNREFATPVLYLGADEGDVF